MKTRHGFVSNSSSSSFVVRRNGGIKDAIITTPEQEKVLLEYGFRKTFAHSPEDVPAFYDEKEWKKEEKFLKKKEWIDRYNFGYEVACNQAEVMIFLIENRIPFAASCHYGMESVIYTGESDEVFMGRNYGRSLEVYGPPDNYDKKMLDKTCPVVTMSGREWLKKNKFVWESC